MLSIDNIPQYDRVSIILLTNTLYTVVIVAVMTGKVWYLFCSEIGRMMQKATRLWYYLIIVPLL
jgi:hypothetical protein